VARLRGAVASLLAVAFSGFFIFRVLPGDPVRTITRGRPVSAAQLAALRHSFGLDKPLVAQFGDYLLRLARGDLGVSYQYRTPVLRLVLDHLAATVYLVGSATLVAAALGLWLGARTAWRRGSTSDRVHTGIAL